MTRKTASAHSRELVIHNSFPGREFTKAEQQRAAYQILLQLNMEQSRSPSPDK